MTYLAKRAAVFHYDKTVGGKRRRVSLGTTDLKAAKRIAAQIEFATADGPRSEAWRTLKKTLPPASFRTLASGIHPVPSAVIEDVERRVYEKLDRRENLGEIRRSTHDFYRRITRTFFGWAGQRVRLMDEISPGLIDEYLVWRQGQILNNPRSSNASMLSTESSVLSMIFNQAVEEDIIRKTPVQSRVRIAPGRAVEPFSKSDMVKLEETARDPRFELVFLLFRFTGLRGSDAADLTWSGIKLDDRTLRWQTRKRKNWVIIPLAAPLADRLLEEFKRGQPAPEDRVLAKFGTGRQKLYQLVQSLGKAAGVPNCHPHRFRHSLACTILEKGGTIFDVAKILGDTVAVAEKHYASYTERMQDRVRGILESTYQESS